MIGFGVVVAVVRRPHLWVTAVRQLWRHCHRAHGLPRPSAAWLRFRLLTATGSDRGRFDPRDVVDYLEWCRTSRL